MPIQPLHVRTPSGTASSRATSDLSPDSGRHGRVALGGKVCMLPSTLRTRLRWPALLPIPLPTLRFCKVGTSYTRRQRPMGQSPGGAHPIVSQPFNLRSIKWALVPRPWDDARLSLIALLLFKHIIISLYAASLCQLGLLSALLFVNKEVYYSSRPSWRRR